MRFSLNWLNEHLQTQASVQQIADDLVKLGIEVEEIEDEAARFNNVVIGHVITRDPHPDADRLGICTVDVGEDAPRTIVCGAPNVRAGLTVAVALEGACLPCGIEITPTKIRGIKSNGMICSERELGLGEDHNGIMELELNAKPGDNFAQAYGLNGVVFDVSITPNRGDALSVYGLARDLAANGTGTLTPLEEKPLGDNPSPITVALKTDDCPYFCGIMINDIDLKPSPMWLQEHLISAGLRPINAVVDVTNLICLGLGQPLHSYDADKVTGNIYVANAKGGEKFVALDEKEYILAEGDIGIYDDSGLIGLAGIMGGLSTAVDDTTKNIFLEGAWFDRSRIARTGQRLQINSDARHRAERGIDQALRPTSSAIAANIIQNVCGGTLSSLFEVGNNMAERPTIHFDPTLVKTFGGLDVEKADICDILTRLGFRVDDKGQTLDLIPPTWRTYMTTPEDVVEEVLRLKGFDAVPSVIPNTPTKSANHLMAYLPADRTARRTLVSLGYIECVNYSFINAQKAHTFAEGAPLVSVNNPIDEDTMSTMRPSLIPSLLEAAQRNMARSEQHVTLGEVGKTYTAEGETLRVAGLISGTPKRHWQGQPAEATLFSAKAHALALMEALGLNPEKMLVRSGGPSYLHPGKSGTFALGKNVFGVFGEIHPKLLKDYDIKGTPCVFELDVEALDAFRMKPGTYTSSTYQSVHRDFAFLVDENAAAGDIINTLKAADKELVRAVELFDVYQGDKLPEGKKSLALTMTLQAADRTLTEDEINAVASAAVKNVEKRFGAELRS